MIILLSGRLSVSVRKKVASISGQVRMWVKHRCLQDSPFRYGKRRVLSHVHSLESLSGTDATTSGGG